MDRDLMRRRVAEARVARFATVRPDGGPHVVPVVFALAEDTLYSSVDDKPKASRQLVRIRNIRANPQVSVLVDRYTDDWTKLWWVRLDGRAEILEAGEERTRALELLARKYPQYRDEMPPQGDVIAVHVASWRGWAW